jgi:hypothetical protein
MHLHRVLAPVRSGRIQVGPELNTRSRRSRPGSNRTAFRQDLPSSVAPFFDPFSKEAYARSLAARLNLRGQAKNADLRKKTVIALTCVDGSFGGESAFLAPAIRVPVSNTTKPGVKSIAPDMRNPINPLKIQARSRIIATDTGPENTAADSAISNSPMAFGHPDVLK